MFDKFISMQDRQCINDTAMEGSRCTTEISRVDSGLIVQSAMMEEKLRPSKCSQHRRLPSMGAKKLKRALGLQNILEMIPETASTTSSETNDDEESYTGDNYRQTSADNHENLRAIHTTAGVRETPTNLLEPKLHPQSLAVQDVLDSQQRKRLKRGQVELKSGALVLISQRERHRPDTHTSVLRKSDSTPPVSSDSSDTDDDFDKNNNRSTPRRYSEGSNHPYSTSPCSRTPVTVKVFQSSCGNYAVVTPSRHHQSAFKPLCLRLKRSRVTLNPEVSPSTVASVTPPCRFLLTLGGMADGKSFLFEASSSEAATEWASVLVATTKTSVSEASPMLSMPMTTDCLNTQSGLAAKTWNRNANGTPSKNVSTPITETKRKYATDCICDSESDEVFGEPSDVPTSSLKDISNNNTHIAPQENGHRNKDVRTHSPSRTNVNTDKQNNNNVKISEDNNNKDTLTKLFPSGCDMPGSAVRDSHQHRTFISRNFLGVKLPALSYTPTTVLPTLLPARSRDNLLPTLSESSEEEETGNDLWSEED